MSSEFRPQNPILRTLCAWRGFGLVTCGDQPLLIDTGGNQCPWRGSSSEACPCEMEVSGESPNAEVCHLAHEARAGNDLPGITVWPHEMPAGVSADRWLEYVSSPSCPRIENIINN